MLIAFLLPFLSYLCLLKDLNKSYLNDDDDDDDSHDSGCLALVVRGLHLKYIYKYIVVCYNDDHGMKVLVMFMTSIVITVMCTSVSVTTALESQE